MKNNINNFLSSKFIYVKKYFRLFKFAAVGGFGIIVNMFFLWFFIEVVDLFYLVSSSLAIEISIINNFIWNYMWTWHDRKVATTKAFLLRFLKYNFSMMFAAIANLILLGFFKETFGLHYFMANMIGITGGFLLNYILSDRWIFK